MSVPHGCCGQERCECRGRDDITPSFAEYARGYQDGLLDGRVLGYREGQKKMRERAVTVTETVQQQYAYRRCFDVSMGARVAKNKIAKLLIRQKRKPRA